MRILGDIHGEIDGLINAINGSNLLVQVGDWGWGDSFEFLYQNPGIENVKFIHGNHEWYSKLPSFKQYLGRYGVYNNDEHSANFFYMSGAWSIDHMYQKMHGVWSASEELFDDEIKLAIDLYKATKPRVVISHTAPKAIAQRLINPDFGNVYYENRTELAMQEMIDIHSPDLWVFGHWHQSYETTYNQTIFRCLNINEYIDID